MRPTEPGDAYRALVNRVERLERASVQPPNNLVSVSDATIRSQVPTTSFVALAGGQVLTFTAGPSGRALVEVYINHTLETASGTPIVWIAPEIDSMNATTNFAVSIYSALGVSPWSESGLALGKVYTGLTPGEHTVSLAIVKSVTGSVLNYHLNNHTLAVTPL